MVAATAAASMAMLGGRERTAEEYRTLLKSAGLRMIRTLATVSPHLADRS